MAHDRPDGALAPLAPGPLHRIECGALRIDVAPAAGGRIAQIVHDGVAQLVGPDDGDPATIAWGCYPMLPWAGRVRDGCFRFDGADHRLTPNLGAHPIHGVGFAMPWSVDRHTSDRIELSLQLPRDARWPFGGLARQTLEVGPGRLRLGLTVEAQDTSMPAVIGWHPWFRKPDRLVFAPTHVYPRDTHGIATLPPAAVPPPPWDDCFLGAPGAVLHHGHRRLTLTSDCDHWVVFDETAHATCVEPQSGPPDAFNLGTGAASLAPGGQLARWFEMVWNVG